MAAPTVSAVTPANVVAGAAPVAMTITGTGFDVSAPDVTASGLVIQDIDAASATSITALVSALPTKRGATQVTVETTDGSVAHAGPVVKTAAVNSSLLDAYAANPGPGSVAAASSAVGSTTETTHQALNPAFDPTNEQGTESQQQAGIRDPEVPDPVAPTLGDNPGADRDAAGQEADLRDHSPQLPAAPAITSATAGAAGHATINWTAPSDTGGWDLSGYHIVATSSDGGAAATKDVAGTVLTADVSGLTSSKHYTFTVAAVNAAGTGAASTASSSVTIS